MALAYTGLMNELAPTGTADAADFAASTLATIRAVVGSALQEVDARLAAELGSEVELIQQVGQYLIAAGGKRLRPMLLLLVHEALTGSVATIRGNGHGSNTRHALIGLAAALELIHSATLLHDDVVDESDLRRDRATANAVYGNAASVLAGDFLYSRAFQLMVEFGDMAVMDEMARTTNAIAEGEVLQLLHRGNPDTNREAYARVIERKTARLFAAAAVCGALAADTPAATPNARELGHHLGMAFQISDDLADLGAGAYLGKTLGDDLAEGKATLPVIIAIERSGGVEQARLRQIIGNGERSALPELLTALNRTGAIDAARIVARQHADRARSALAGLAVDNSGGRALARLCQYAAERC